jgi:hypothetical protein
MIDPRKTNGAVRYGFISDTSYSPDHARQARYRSSTDVDAVATGTHREQAAELIGPSSEDVAAGDDSIPIRRLGKVPSTILKYCERLLPRDWRVLQWSMETDEVVVESLGSVEIHRVPAGCIVQTCVEGDMDTARGVALARLAQYLSGDNRSGVSLDAERPVVQQRNAPEEWLVSVRLPALQDAAAAPAPRRSSIWIVSQDPAILAVVRVNGGPCEQAIARAEATVAAALEHTRWLASGPAIVRVHAPGSLLPFADSCEVAIPVAERVCEAALPTARKECATAASPLVR